MPPQLATLVFAIGTLGLFWLDRDRERRTSPALWLPIIWLAIGGSRNVSQWLSPAGAGFSPDQILEGSPLDRAIMSGLIAFGLAVLAARRGRTLSVIGRNLPLLVFFLFCGVSLLWSDFPFVAFKRWTKVLGNVVMVLVVLTDPDRETAVKKFFTRTAFLLIPASVLLIKYYPEYRPLLRSVGRGRLLHRCGDRQEHARMHLLRIRHGHVLATHRTLAPDG